MASLTPSPIQLRLQEAARGSQTSCAETMRPSVTRRVRSTIAGEAEAGVGAEVAGAVAEAVTSKRRVTSSKVAMVKVTSVEANLSTKTMASIAIEEAEDAEVTTISPSEVAAVASTISHIEEPAVDTTSIGEAEVGMTSPTEGAEAAQSNNSGTSLLLRRRKTKLESC